MVDVSFVIPMLDPVLWLGFATNATMDHIKEDVLFVGLLVSVMLIIVKNVHY